MSMSNSARDSNPHTDATFGVDAAWRECNDAPGRSHTAPFGMLGGTRGGITIRSRIVAMSDRYLEVSYRNGKAFAAYLFLPRRPDDRSARTERFSEILVIDYADDGRAIGIESVHPQAVKVEEINRALAHVDQSRLREEDFAPLRAA